MTDFVLLVFSLTVWMVSLFLVGEAAKSQRWVFRGTEGIPDPYSGVTMSQLLSLVFIVLWLGRLVLTNRLSVLQPSALLTEILVRPVPIIPGIVLASFPPLIVGIVKLATVLVVRRGTFGEEDFEARNRLRVTLLFLGFHLLTAAVGLLLLKRMFP